MEATSTVPLVIEAANNVTIAATVIVLAIIVGSIFIIGFITINR